MAGGYDGNVYKLDNTTRTDNGSAINMYCETPSLTYGDEWLLKNLANIGVSLNAFSDSTVSVTWTLDGTTSFSAYTSQGNTGSTFDNSLFVTAVFGGNAFLPRFFGIENGGDFRSISYTFFDTANNTDIELHGFMAKITPCGESEENA